MSILSRFKESRTGHFWLVYDKKIVLVTGIVLIAAVSFEAGYLKGQQNKNEPIVVSKIATTEVASANDGQKQPDTSSTKTAPVNSKPISTENVIAADNQKCAYVASKNSNKYHLATCQFAQKIKPENRVCFASADEAIKRGYQGAKCCIK
ncbi:MAG TPA: hypothetical protein VK254_02950 [Candidatus Bathyarchaeia archaeon]|nr:hypothetical protein [Candidatus Bathyarchaeia archaeon]